MSQVFLITGGAGNLACQLTHELAARGDCCVLFDVAPQPVAELAEGSEYLRGDITEFAEVDHFIAERRPDVVIHFASLLSGSSEENRPLAWRVNMDGAFALLESCARHGVTQLFFPSSVAAYGTPLPNPVPEDQPQWPTGLYGVTKLAVERLGVYYWQKHRLDFRSIRLPVVISRYAPAGAASAYASRAFVESAESGGYTFRVREETSPSLIYVKDVLRAMLLLLDADAERLTRRVYNIQAVSPRADEIAAAVKQRLPAADIRFEPEEAVVRLIESWPVRFDDAAARQDWNWAPQYDLDALADDMLREMGVNGS